MKKIMYLSILSLCMAFSLIIEKSENIVANTEVMPSGMVYNVTSAAVLRSAPNTNDSTNVIASINKGTNLIIIGESSGGSWWKVLVEKKEGYIHKNYVLEVRYHGIVYNVASTVNFRSTPNSSNSSNIISIHDKGTNVMVLGANESGSWKYVQIGSKKGWIHSDYILENGHQGTVIAYPFLNKGPGTATEYGKVIEKSLPKGASVTILNTSITGSWKYIKVGDIKGWVHSDYVVEAGVQGTVVYKDVKNTTINFRSKPLVPTNGSDNVIKTLTTGTSIIILGTSENENWKHVQVGSQKGWITAGNVYEAGLSETISGGNPYFRKGPGTSHDYVITSTPALTKGKKVSVLGVSSGGNWTRVLSDGNEGWISSNYITKSTSLSKEAKVIAETKKHLGKGRKNPNNVPTNFDCSSLTEYVYNQVLGITIERTAKNQANMTQYKKITGLKVEDSEGNFDREATIITIRNKLKPGDLMFFRNSSGTISHVAIYLGNSENDIIHSSGNEETGKVNENTFKGFKWYPEFARRIIVD